MEEDGIGSHGRKGPVALEEEKEEKEKKNKNKNKNKNKSGK